MENLTPVQKKRKNRGHSLIWAALFCALCFGLYSHALHKKRKTHFALQIQLATLQKEKEGLVQEKEDLLLNIRSQNDPAWIELVLMKVLGLVPEGKVKVYFEPTAPHN